MRAQGAGDYIVEPFSPTELAARIQAAMLRQDAPSVEPPGDPYVLETRTETPILPKPSFF